MNKKPTPSQVRHMEALIDGRLPDCAAMNSQDALHRRKWIHWPLGIGRCNPVVTEAGYKALEAYYGEAIDRPATDGGDDGPR